MDREAIQSLAIASTLAAFLAALSLLVTPSLADDLPPSAFSQPMPAYTRLAAPNAADMPQAVQAGKIRYITGGIGQEERDALEAVKNSYNLHVVSTNDAGEFNGNMRIAIRDGHGNELMSSKEVGPLFFASLAPGAYTVEAVSNGQVQKKPITIGSGKPLSLYFRW